MTDIQTPSGTDDTEVDNTAGAGTVPDAGKDQGNPNPEQEPDYKQKFSESSREAQRLATANTQLEKDLAAERAKNVTPQQVTPSADPLASEIKQLFPEYDQLDDFAKRVAQNQFNQHKQLMELTARNRWQSEMETLTADSRYSKLAADRAFQAYALKPENRGVNLNILANSYLFESGSAAPAAPAPEPSPEAALPRGSGGPRGEQNMAKKYKASELRTLRETDFKAWRELTSKIDMVDDVIDG
ncbi:MAG: hypothetical protein U0892_15610 [Pirellulales bacterium]